MPLNLWARLTARLVAIKVRPTPPFVLNMDIICAIYAIILSYKLWEGLSRALSVSSVQERQDTEQLSSLY